MTVQEFSNEFDILYNNISSNAAPGLNEYEKSYFLSKAQLEIIRNYFNPKGNKYNEGYDGSLKRQIDFSMITKVAEMQAVSTPAQYVKIDSRSLLYQLPTDVLYVLSETAKTTYDNYSYRVNIVPITFEQYNALISRPYKYPFKYQGWRLIQSKTAPVFEIIVKGTLSDYKMRYVRMPNPIILINLNTDVDYTESFSSLSINGQYTPQTCELDPSIHQDILNRAVELAKNAALGDLSTTVQLNRAE